MSFLHNETDHGHCCFQFDSIEQFQFSYLTGNDINGRVVYAIKLQSGFYHVMIQLNHRLKEESDYFLVDELFLQYLLSILKDNQVDQWDGFNEMDNTAMDVTSVYLFQMSQGVSLRLDMNHGQRTITLLKDSLMNYL